MRRLKMFGLLVVAVFVMGVITAASASAEALVLPDIHTSLPGETYPLHANGEATVTAEGEISLKTENSQLPASKVTTLLLVLELSALGPAGFTFSVVHEKAKPANLCNSEGDASGIVLVPNAEFHLVFTQFTPKLEIAALVLFTPFTIKCPLLNVKVLGSSMVRINPVTDAGGDTTKIEAASKCVKPGIAEVSSFFNDAGTEVKNALLQAELGLGEENGCEEVKPTVLLELLEEKMLTILY